jgi:DTW domain-containing protein
MTRVGNAHYRCGRCRMHLGLCICKLIPALETRTRLVLVIHRFEDNKPTNTGRLAAACVRNSHVVLRGDSGMRSPPVPIAPDTIPLLLFPSDDSEPLEGVAASLTKIGRAATLNVPDGSWRQAAKVRKRLPGLEALRCVHLPSGEPSLYRLRAAPELERLSTIEAVARALGILEGPELRRAIELPFHAMVERTLWMRGKLEVEAVASGIPEGAERHDPMSGLGSAPTKTR